MTHTSVARTQHLIGRSEFLDWIAYYELKQKAEEDAVKGVKKQAPGKAKKTPADVMRELEQQGR